MSDAYNQLMAEHRRLAILRFLAHPKTNGTSNDSILQTVVVREAGIASSRDQIKTALTWLEEQDLVSLSILESGTFVATIRQRGFDVAAGLLTVPGVQRPAPGA
ncbi:MAG: ArsR family transcriptional regulator [Geobacteraceae bacterium]|nr:ArsR family transcriptional regulator [Geobacteraceae bacterium]